VVMRYRHSSGGICLALATCFSFFVSALSWAEDSYLKDDEIVNYLNDKEVTGNQKGTQWRQTFASDGETYYEEVNGFRPAFGRWRAQNDAYCSQWPPSDIWTCYKVSTDGDRITFIPPKGDPWPAVRIERK